MRKIVVSEFMTLDGVIEAPGDEESLGDKSGWTFAFWSDDQAKFKLDELLSGGALLLGKNTYQGFAAAWPSRTDEQGFADRMNSLPKYVVSSTLERAEWNNSTIIKGNIAEKIAELKKQPGQDILVFGSGSLVQALIEYNLVDEYRLMVFPVVLGTGKHLFQEHQNKIELKLVDNKTFPSGVVVLTYQ